MTLNLFQVKRKTNAALSQSDIGISFSKIMRVIKNKNEATIKDLTATDLLKSRNSLLNQK